MLKAAGIVILFYGAALIVLSISIIEKDILDGIIASALMLPLEVFGFALFFHAILELRDERRDNVRWQSVRQQQLYAMADLLNEFTLMLSVMGDYLINDKDKKICSLVSDDIKKNIDFYVAAWKNKFNLFLEKAQIYSPSFNPQIATLVVDFVEELHVLEVMLAEMYEAAEVSPPDFFRTQFEFSSASRVSVDIEKGRLPKPSASIRRCEESVYNIGKIIKESFEEKPIGLFLSNGSQIRHVDDDYDYYDRTYLELIRAFIIHSAEKQPYEE